MDCEDARAQHQQLFGTELITHAYLECVGYRFNAVFWCKSGQKWRHRQSVLCWHAPTLQRLGLWEQVQLGQLLSVFGLRFGRNGPVEVFANEVLGFFGVQKVQIRFSHFAGAFAV